MEGGFASAHLPACLCACVRACVCKSGSETEINVFGKKHIGLGNEIKQSNSILCEMENISNINITSELSCCLSFSL
jgi:hypothetical protein